MVLFHPKYFITASLSFTLALHANISVQFQIDVTKDVHPISPYIYGSNTDELTQNEGVTFRRSGGNRLTGYNWENNASNAGTDWYSSSDSYLGLDNQPGKAITDFVNKTNKSNATSLVTLQAAGYVANDKTGNVTAGQTAPSSRWAKVVFEKGKPFTETPDVSDGEVYMDEFVNLLTQQIGNATTKNGVKFYSIDNEPGIWKDTHPYLHPLPATGAELVQKTAALAKAVKQVDPKAEIFGGVFFGYYDFACLANLADWNTINTGKNYDWFIDYFLDEMKKASDKIGYRLLDVIDIHWYPEAIGEHRINDANATTAKDRAARLQAPRSLWDTSYAENSWISKTQTPKLPVTDWNNPTPGPINLLPRIWASIQKYYPGTKLSISEYNYGEANHITGGLAGVDFLGVMGREQIYASNFWQMAEKPTFLASAFRLYRNYDGKFSAFPGNSVSAKSSDNVSASIFAALNENSDQVNIIVVNKSTTDSLLGNFNVTVPTKLNSGKVFGFEELDTNVVEKKSVSSISGNSFAYAMPPLSARHFILKASSTTSTISTISTIGAAAHSANYSNRRTTGASTNFYFHNGLSYSLNGKIFDLKNGFVMPR